MRVSSFLLGWTAVLAMEGTAWACNFCKEDNRAAVYSYEAVEKVRADPGRFEFVVLKIVGKLPPNGDKALEDWLKLKAGVDPATVRVSGHQKAVGFVLDRSMSQEEILRDLQHAFPELTFRILRFEKETKSRLKSKNNYLCSEEDL